MITLTDSAQEKINTLLSEEGNPNFKVRAFVTGGGCSGFNYGFTFDEEIKEDDFIVGSVVVDAMSMQYLQGCTIDFKNEKMSSQFVIKNPNATATCGCGQSFAA